MLQQAHAIAAAEQEIARLAAADHRAAIAQHEHKLQQMHEAQVCWAVGKCGASKSMLSQHYLAAIHAFGSLSCLLLSLSPSLPPPCPSRDQHCLLECGQS